MSWKEDDTASMKRLIITTVITLCGKAVLITGIVAAVIGVLGYVKEWDTALAYSNAFFLAGCLVIAASGLSRLNAGQEWNVFRSLYAESFRDKTVTERANYILNESSSAGFVLLGFLSGLMLILISALVLKLS
jgi:hypothetical protein